MKYITINELNHFNFHDAELQKINLNNGNMIWQLSLVNATIQNSQNSFNEDMCIKEAEIVFENFNIEKIVFGAYKVYDSNNVLIKSVESKIEPPEFEIEPIKKSLVFYKKMFERLLNSEHLNLGDIKAAIINIDYDFIHRQWSKTNPDFELSVYTCKVDIEATNGKIYSAIVPEWWKY